MRLAFDLESRRIVDPDDLTSNIPSLAFRRGEVIPVEVQIVREGVVVEEPDAEIEFYVTESDDFSSLLTSADSIVASGSGVETVFIGSIDLDETAVDELFTSGAVASVDAKIEFRLSTPAESYRSEPVDVVIGNSYKPTPP